MSVSANNNYPHFALRTARAVQGDFISAARARYAFACMTTSRQQCAAVTDAFCVVFQRCHLHGRMALYERFWPASLRFLRH